MRQTRNFPSGTSYFGQTIEATVEQLTELLGEPYNDYNNGDDKVNYEWIMETDNGDVFTIYDWKYYRPLHPAELVHWHIGGFNGQSTITAKNELNKELSKLAILKNLTK